MLKKKSAISIDGADAALEDTTVMPAEVPTGFFTFGYFAMKYLVVKAFKGQQIYQSRIDENIFGLKSFKKINYFSFLNYYQCMLFHCPFTGITLSNFFVPI